MHQFWRLNPNKLKNNHSHINSNWNKLDMLSDKIKTNVKGTGQSFQSSNF